MKIGGVKIINLDSLKGKFDLTEVWENIENGVLLDCQQDFVRQKADLAEPIVKVLEVLDKDRELEELVFSFYQNGNWNLEGLEEVLKPFSGKSKDHKGNHFYSRNKTIIQNFIRQKQIVWDEKKAGFFYLFLLLMLQVRPRAEILNQDILFLERKLEEEKSNRKEERKGFQMYPYASGVLYLKDGKIVNEKGKQFSPEQEQISFFAYTEKLGIIAFTKQGEISDCTEANLKYEIGNKLKEQEEKRIVMAAAYGSIYLLLIKNGQVISNVKDKIDSWKEIQWVGVGLNSLTAIREKNKNLLELGSDNKITEFSNVKAAYTWSEGICRYGILKENGTFIMDDGIQIEGVCAANIEREGYLYATKETLYFRKFGEKKKVKYQTNEGGRITEVWKYHTKIYFLVEEKQINELEIEVFCEEADGFE